MNFKKLVQVVNYVMAKYDYRLDYMKLIKLLYIADRACLERWSFAITRDSYCSMKNGPVLETLYSLIKGDGERQKEWDKLFDKDGYDLVVKIKCDDYGKLSRGETEIIDSVDKKYHDKDKWYLVDEVHKFPEWNKETAINNTSVPLTMSDILRVLGRSEEEIDELVSLERTHDEMIKLFGAHND